MRSYLTLSKVMLLFCMSFIVSLTACSSDEEEDTSPSRPKEEVLEFMQNKLYDSDGNVVANKLNSYVEGEYNLIADKEDEVREWFHNLTGIDIPLQNTYRVVYQSKDGKCTISIEGREAPSEGVYATVRFSVAEYPQLKVLHIATMVVFDRDNGTTSGSTSTDDLPHRVKGIN